MDKFGVFNLINSFLTYYKNSATKNPQDNNSGSVANTFTAPVVPSNPSSADNHTEKPSAKPPVLELFNAMSSHEEFVKRVLKNNKK